MEAAAHMKAVLAPGCTTIVLPGYRSERLADPHRSDEHPNGSTAVGPWCGRGDEVLQ